MLSLKFNSTYINDFESVVGPNEKNGNIRNVTEVIDDFYYGEKTFEKAQIKMNNKVLDNLLRRNNLISNDIDIIIGGDLSNQIGSTAYSLDKYSSSFLGIYSACSTFVEGLILSSILLKEEKVKKVITITSSHNLSAERQFRYPVEYGSIRNVNSTFTATAAITALISNKKGKVRICDATIGSLINSDINDPNMIGAVMAPAAAEALIEHLNNFNRDINYYDLVVTGDLGNVGLNIFKDYLKEEFNLDIKKVVDAGSMLYKNIEDINDGASGPCALPLYFFYNIINQKKYKKILLISTGSMHSSTLVNQKENIPAISHVISLEVLS